MGFAGVITPTYPEVTTIGDVNTQTTINGPTIQNIVIPSTSYAYGEVNAISVTGPGVLYPGDVFLHADRNATDWNTTAHDQHGGVAAFESNLTHSAGSHVLVSTSLECDSTITGAAATSNDVRECIRAFNGDITVDNGNLTLNGASANIFLTGSSSFFATLGSAFFEGITTGIDITSTIVLHAIKVRQQNSIFDFDNAAASSVTFQNDGSSGTFGGLKLSGLASTITTVWLSPLTPTSVSHGTLATGSTNTDGAITGIGSNTSVVLTPSASGGTFSHSWCVFTPSAVQLVAAPPGTTTVTVSCFAAATGVAANCVDLTYHCLYQ